MAKFPTDEWLSALVEKLNSDPDYARIAHNWEWDLKLVFDPSGALLHTKVYYLDLWHGKCRNAETLSNGVDKQAAFVLKAPYDNFARIVSGKLDPIQAMLTRKLQVQGPMSVMLRNVPTVMYFVRCCRQVTDSFI